jgi:hypothetical protein
VTDEFEQHFGTLSEDFIKSVCERIESNIDGWKVDEKDAKSFDPNWTPEQVKWFNDGVDSVKQLISAMRNGDL